MFLSQLPHFQFSSLPLKLLVFISPQNFAKLLLLIKNFSRLPTANIYKFGKIAYGLSTYFKKSGASENKIWKILLTYRNFTFFKCIAICLLTRRRQIFRNAFPTNYLGKLCKQRHTVYDLEKNLIRIHIWFLENFGRKNSCSWI